MRQNFKTNLSMNLALAMSGLIWTIIGSQSPILAQDPAVANSAVPNYRLSATLDVWPDLAPGESSRETGTLLPQKAGEAKPIDRVVGVYRPTLDVYPATRDPTGTAVLILPGGGFTYVVPNLEGSEAAEWLRIRGFDQRN